MFKKRTLLNRVKIIPSANLIIPLGGVLVRAKELEINIEDMSIKKELELGKVLVVILDGNQRKAKCVEAVEHGFTIIETAKGKATKIKFEEGELF